MGTIPFGFVAFTLLIAGMSAIALFGDPGRRRLAKRARRVAGEDDEKRPAAGMPRLRLNRQGGLDAVIHRMLPRPDAVRVRLAATGGNLSIGAYGLISIGVAVAVPVILLLRGLSPLPSVLLGLLAWSSRSLIPGMIGHGLMDVGLFAYWWTGIAGSFHQLPLAQTGMDLPFLAAAVAFAASLLAVLFAVYKLCRVGVVSS